MQIVVSPDPEAIVAQSGEMETDHTQSVCPWKVLTIPPVWISHRLMALSLLPDTRKAPSDEKVRASTESVCLERMDVQVPVVTSRILISPEVDPTATTLFQHVRVCGKLLKGSV